MKWVNHQIVTGVAVYAMTEDLLLTGASILGAVIPDKIEGNPFEKRHFWQFWKWHMTHRGWSHCPTVYMFFIALLYLSTWHQTLVSYSTIWLRDLGMAFFLGAVLHIVEDAFCGKVPLITPAHKIGVRWFKVGSIGEYLFAIAAVLVIYGIKIMI